jgi:hypothetical protein
MAKLYFWYCKEGPLAGQLWVTTDKKPQREVILEIEIDMENSGEAALYALIQQAVQLKAGGSHIGTVIAMMLGKVFVAGADWGRKNRDQKIIAP